MIEVEDVVGEWRPARVAAGVLGRPGFERWHLRVAVDATSEQVAVRRDYRGRGLGQALLRSAFAAAREHGAPIGELSTDSPLTQ